MDSWLVVLASLLGTFSSGLSVELAQVVKTCTAERDGCWLVNNTTENSVIIPWFHVSSINSELHFAIIPVCFAQVFSGLHEKLLITWSVFHHCVFLNSSCWCCTTGAFNGKWEIGIF